MKKIKGLVLMVAILSLVSCYRVNEYKFLFITFNESKANTKSIKKYIDSAINKNEVMPDSIKEKFLSGNELPANERIIHFKNNPEEWYRIVFDADPCWIKSIYNRQLADTVIHNRSLLGNKEIDRIKVRFEREILNRVQQNGNVNN